MSEEVSYEARLVDSFVPPPLRLAAAGAMSTDGDMALLWLDVVGFTNITGRLVETGPAGIEQMAAVLDRHFDALIGSIVAHGGEPLMFAGDALLSGWRCSAGTPREAVLRAAACGRLLLSPGARAALGDAAEAVEDEPGAVILSALNATPALLPLVIPPLS